MIRPARNMVRQSTADEVGCYVADAVAGSSSFSLCLNSTDSNWSSVSAVQCTGLRAARGPRARPSSVARLQRERRSISSEVTGRRRARLSALRQASSMWLNAQRTVSWSVRII